jgi:hypothetical protein
VGGNYKVSVDWIKSHVGWWVRTCWPVNLKDFDTNDPLSRFMVILWGCALTCGVSVKGQEEAELNNSHKTGPNETNSVSERLGDPDSLSGTASRTLARTQYGRCSACINVDCERLVVRGEAQECHNSALRRDKGGHRPTCQKDSICNKCRSPGECTKFAAKWDVVPNCGTNIKRR